MITYTYGSGGARSERPTVTRGINTAVEEPEHSWAFKYGAWVMQQEL